MGFEYYAGDDLAPSATVYYWECFAGHCLLMSYGVAYQVA